MAYEKQFWDESYNDCQECKRLDQALNKLRSENESLKSRLEILQDSVNANTHESFHQDAYIETLHNWIKSDSIYALLRHGIKSPTNAGVDGSQDDFYADMYDLSVDLREKERQEIENAQDDFEQRQP